jgi:hypothetical protein
VRMISTRSVSSHSSAGILTAWLLPFMKTRVVSVVMDTLDIHTLLRVC